MREYLRPEMQSVNKNLPPTILLFSPSVSGGLAEHTFYQARALRKAGAKVTCLVAPSFLDGRPIGFETVICLNDPPPADGSQLVKKFKMMWRLITNQLVLAWQIWKHRPDLVLLDSYVEYVAPLWVWPHWLLARFLGILYAANLHDPVRNYRVGPVWWHRLSVRLAYLPLDFVLVHNRLPEPSPVPSPVRVVPVPVGVYDLPDVSVDRQKMRRRWGIQQGQKVFLSFGYVRDGKNLDLAIRALRSVPEAFLVIAGAVASTKDKPFTFYHELAQSEGVADRVKFYEGFVSNDELANYFVGTDFVLLTYSSAFHSQSAVLNIAVRARIPVLASASPSPLLESVKRFELGVTVKPDSVETIVDGIHQLLGEKLQPRWENYAEFADWDANARGILTAAGLLLPLSVGEAGQHSK
jgi:glycosyltransferase involved in cell wall biosynthesis